MAEKAGLLPGTMLIPLQVFEDARGYFMEAFNEKLCQETYGIHERFVQDNYSSSKQNVLRGLHYQIEKPQGKLVRVVSGRVFDVAVDLRRSSPTFGKWMGIELDAKEPQLLWIPPGFAHGFLALSEQADFFYKTTDFYYPPGERCLAWNDPLLGIEWPLKEAPLISAKDQKGAFFQNAEVFL